MNPKTIYPYWSALLFVGFSLALTMFLRSALMREARQLDTERLTDAADLLSINLLPALAFDQKPEVASLVDMLGPQYGIRVSRSDGLGNEEVYYENKQALMHRNPIFHATARIGTRRASPIGSVHIFSTPKFERFAFSNAWSWVILDVGFSFGALGAGLLVQQIRWRVKESALASQLRKSRDDLESAFSERQRICRDLHDTTIQSIYAIGLGLQRARRLVGADPSFAAELITSGAGDLNLVLKELRNAISTLDPTPTAVPALHVALQSMIKGLQQTCETNIIFNADAGLSRLLTTGEELHLINIVREAISNALRHGDPSEIRVSMKERGEDLIIEVVDNGCGFTQAACASVGRGLRNMKRRAAEAGAQFQIYSKAGEGTRVCLRLRLTRG